MSWQDRLQVASYTASNNVEIEFEYEDVSMSYTNKGAAFNFPNGTSTYVQRSGSTGRTYPIAAIFHGDNYDLLANAFMELLRIGGIGKLKHPIYGTVDVVPLGEISRSDKLKSGAGEATVEVAFLQTSGIVFPTTQDNPESNVVAQLAEYYAQGSQKFADDLSIETVEQQVAVKSQTTTLINQARSAMAAIVAVNSKLQNTFNTIYDSILLNLDVLLFEPNVLASQIMTFLSLASNAPDGITNRLAIYAGLGEETTLTPPADSNALANQSLFAQTYVAGAVNSCLQNEFETKTDALNAAVFILEMFDSINSWYDESLSVLDVIDTGGAYEALQDAVAVAAGYLIEISFSLKQERLLTLTAPRALVELVYELYGELDEQYDFFINSNNLTGSEILLLPAGKTIRYYV